MSKITKLLAMLLALVMVVSLFAGCKETTEQPKDTAAPTQGTENNKPDNGNTGGNDQLSAEVPVENDMFPLEKPVTFRIGVRGQKEYQSLIERCEWYKYLCEKTNVHLQLVVLGDDYMDTLNA